MKTAAVLALGFALALPSVLWGHCDRVDGPVAVAAREALQVGQLARAAIWVGADQEKELTEAYELAMEARKQGGPAAAVAERYMVEAAVRLHREAEGLPFDGVKAASTPLPADIVAADRALASGRVDELIELLSGELEREVRELYEAAKREEAGREQSVAAGRQWVDAYVRYVGFVHGLHATIEAGPEHGVGHRD
jgi:hypothetical protein